MCETAYAGEALPGEYSTTLLHSTGYTISAYILW